MPLLLTLPSAMRGNLKGMFFLCLVSTLYLVQGFDHFRSCIVLLGRSRGVFRACSMRNHRPLRPQLREYNAANEADAQQD